MRKRTLIITAILICYISVSIFPEQVAAKLILAYHRLMMKDLEQMDRYLRAKIHESQKSNLEQVGHLVEATLTLFSRPNFDNMIEKLSPILLSELSNNGLTYAVFEKFIDEALIAVKDVNNDIASDAQVTYIIALENWMIEMKGRLNDEDIYKLFKKIVKSDVKISKLAKVSAELHMPYKLVEPVDLSNKLLKEFDEKKQATGVTEKKVGQKAKILQKKKQFESK